LGADFWLRDVAGAAELRRGRGRVAGYSVLKFLTGLEAAALKDRMLTVNSAIIAVSIPAAAKIHHCSCTWYSKFCSHWCMAIQAIGKAMSVASPTSRGGPAEVISRTIKIEQDFLTGVLARPVYIPAAVINIGEAL